MSGEEDESSIEEVEIPLEKRSDEDLKSQLKETDAQIKALNVKKTTIEKAKALRDKKVTIEKVKALKAKKATVEQIKALKAKKATINNELYKRRLLHPPRKIVLVAALLGIIIYAIILRTGHLLDGNYYYIISPDSYLFNRMAEIIISGSTAFPAPTLGTGLAYPLAYTSIVFVSIFHISTSSALVLAGEVLPLVLAVATILLMFAMATKTHNWIIGVFAAFSMAIIPSDYLIQASGYLTRDALSMLLIMLGVFVYYLQRNWHFNIGKWNLSWLIAGIAFLGIEGVLFWEWNAGPPLMFAIIFGCLIFEFISYFSQGAFKGYHPTEISHLRINSKFVVGGLKTIPKRFIKATKQTHWKLFLFVTLVNVLILISLPNMLSLLVGMTEFAVGGTSTAAEAQGLVQSQGGNLWSYALLLIPLFSGFVVALKRRSEGDLFWLGWFLTTFILAFFAQRFITDMAPAAAALISFIFVPMFLKFRTFRARDKILITIFLIGVILTSFASFTMETARPMSIDTNWNNALIYCNQHTPTNATIMTWWDYGYWIDDIAYRTPVFDGSVQTAAQLKDVALAYCTNDTSTTVQIMKEYGATYIIFSTLEVPILPTISNYALGHAYGNGVSVPSNMQNSVYYRFLFGNTTSEDGLTKVYSSPTNNPEVVVLELENT